MTKGRWGATAITLCSLLASGSARAQGEPSPFGAGQQLVLSAERLFGYVHTSVTDSMAGMESTTTINSFAVFSSPLSFATIYSAPRLSLDFFVAPHVSFGAAASYFRTSQEISGAMNVFEPTYSGFLFAPRVGYGATLTPDISLWPRAGVTIMRLTLASGGGSTDDVTVYAFTIEAPVVFTIAPHLFLAGGPTFDFGLGGSDKMTASVGGSTSVDEKATSFGVQLSLGGFF